MIWFIILLLAMSFLSFLLGVNLGRKIAARDAALMTAFVVKELQRQGDPAGKKFHDSLVSTAQRLKSDPELVKKIFES